MRPGNWDMLMVALAVGQGFLLLAAPSFAMIALVIWWNSNTIAHNCIHRPFFHSKYANSLFALWLTLLLGYPHSSWRERHLAHHASLAPRLRFSTGLALQIAALLVLWIVLAARAPEFLIRQYAPGWMLGLALCAIHGYYEHAGGVTSHYGRLYNALCFNDGYHIEHHARPGVHWTRLTGLTTGGQGSAWPAPLRWMDGLTAPSVLEALERVVLRSAILQRWILAAHRRAFEDTLNDGAAMPRRAAIVGGGLFPRTALILRDMLPQTELTLIDCNAIHLDRARGFLGKAGVSFVNARYEGQGSYGLVVIPLSYRGEREALYLRPPAPVVVIHDWIWRRRGQSRIVSFALLKRINVVRR